jgi:Domain of unknown function (DUF4440)
MSRAMQTGLWCFALMGVLLFAAGLRRPAWAEDKKENESYEYTTKEKLQDGDLQALIKSRREVWEAWFAGDVEKLKKILPADVITGDSSNPNWIMLDDILKESQTFGETGQKLISLVFTKNKVQVQGESVILYVHFEGRLGDKEKTTPISGRAVEIFVKRENKWHNSGWFLMHGDGKSQ